jgi:sugar lactone lactonase YvrE
MSTASQGWATIVAAVGLSLAALVPLRAARPLSWSVPADEIARGRADGIAVTSRGRLYLAPRLTELGGSLTPGGPVQVWAMAGDDAGSTYLGTGPEGQILRLEGSGPPRLLATVDEPMVTALAVAPDGSLLAGTAPGGILYRVDRDGRAEPWAETGERYVWSLVFGNNDVVYAGTGERGRILRISPAGEGEVLFDADEPHIVSLEVLPAGDLLAGGAGQGRVYRVDREGHALVLHDDELPEVVAVSTGANGAVLAALVGAARPASRRPALRLRLPDGVSVGSTDEAVSSLEESTGPTLLGTIEGLAADAADAGKERTAGRVVRIDPDGGTTELWRSTRESPFCLARDARGRTLFGTGEPARLYRIDGDGEVALLATLREAQLTSLRRIGRRLLLATSNPAAAYRLEDEPAPFGTFVSRPFDAGGPARWGSIRWQIEGPRDATAGAGTARRVEVYTRTGNSSEPDATWSAWSPALTDHEGSAVINPDGRFLQWRVRQLAGADPPPSLHDVRVRYEPYNRPPRVGPPREIASAARNHDEPRRIGWTAGDPDGDTLEVRLEYRPAGATEWNVAAVTATPEAGCAKEADGGECDGELVWADEALAEGPYEIRVVASDGPGNPPGEGLEAEARPADPVVVDRTAPRVEIERAADGALRVRVEDRLSEIRAVELVAGGRTRHTLRPDDGVCDSRRETYRVEAEGWSGTGWVLRGSDTAGNVVELPLRTGPESTEEGEEDRTGRGGAQPSRVGRS